jgi:hypothetical protein
MAHEGLIPPIDHAVFADTQEEPKEVYEHLAWLRTVPEPVPLLHVASIGRLGDDLLAGCNAAGGRKKTPGADGTIRFASIPAYTAPHHEHRPPGKVKEGITRRQCTREYKVEVVEWVIRRTILGVKPRRRVPVGTMVEQVFGISLDEKDRRCNIMKRFNDRPWSRPSFPLIDLKMTRWDCLDWLKDRVPHQTPRSACVFCPFKRDTEWLITKSHPKDWARAVEIDRALRPQGTVANRGLTQALYLHRQCIPLEMVDLEAGAAREREKQALPLFTVYGCGEGMCGV